MHSPHFSVILLQHLAFTTSSVRPRKIGKKRVRLGLAARSALFLPIFRGLQSWLFGDARLRQWSYALTARGSSPDLL